MFQNNLHQPGFKRGYVKTSAEKPFVFWVQAPNQKFQGWLWGKIHLCTSYVGIMLQEVDPVDTSNLNLRRSSDPRSKQALLSCYVQGGVDVRAFHPPY
jgi:hypothetical protein